jgi:hypothetical protein
VDLHPGGATLSWGYVEAVFFIFFSSAVVLSVAVQICYLLFTFI